jgi:hypothetical protein
VDGRFAERPETKAVRLQLFHRRASIEVVELLRLAAGLAVLRVVETGDLRKILIVELEVEDLEVLADARGRDRFWDDD